MKNYLNFLFLNVFEKISKVLLKDQHYFDIIIDIFLENITNNIKYKKNKNYVKDFCINNFKLSNYINIMLILYESCSAEGKKYNKSNIRNIVI